VTEQFRFEQVLGDAAVLIATNGPLARGLWLCRALATSSLPRAGLTVINTVTMLWLSRRWRENTSCIAGA